MKPFFRRLFNIYAGEERQALLFAALGFLWALGVTLGQKFADALFLIHIGAESLPIAYAIAACVMMLLTAFYLKAFHLIPIDRIFTTVLCAGIAFYSCAYFYLVSHIESESSLLWFALKIFGSGFFAIVITCFWTFIDQYFHLQDGKRLYSLFTSSVFVGIAVTGIIMRFGLLAFENVTLLIIALFIAGIFTIRYIVGQLKPISDEISMEQMAGQGNSTFRILFKAIINSKFTLLLMTGNFLMYVLLVITEYSYLLAFDQRFDPGVSQLVGGEQNAQLTQFLGQCVAGVSVFNLIFGLFIYSRLVRQYGITNLVLYTPIMLVLTFSGWLVSDALVFPLLGFLFAEGLLYVIDDNNFNLLLNAVPQRVKYKIRLIIESFFEPTGMLVSSLLISFVPFNSKLIGLILSTCTLIVVFFLRKQYLKAIFMNLSENAIHFQRSIRDWFLTVNKKQQKMVERRLLAILQRGDETAQLFAIEALLGTEDSTIIPKLLQRADTLTDHAKIAFIDLIGNSVFAENSQMIERLNTWSETPSLPLRNAIYFYLARFNYLYPEDVLSYLKSPDLTQKGAAILTLKHSWPDLPPKEAAQKKALAEQDLQLLLDSKDDDTVCMGVKIIGLDLLSQDIDTLLPFLMHPNPKITRSAAAAISNVIDKHSLRYAPILISHLTTISDTEVRQSLLKALGKIGDPSLVKDIISSSIHFRPNERRLTESILAGIKGDLVPTLLAITKDSSMHDRCRVLAGRILGRLNLPTLQKHLYEIVSAEIQRAYFYFYHSHTIQQEYPHLDLSLLKDALISSFHSVLDFIIQLLGVAGESEDCELLSRSLRNPNPKLRSQVLETLERTCETRIYRSLYPLIAELPFSEKIHAATKAIEGELTLAELLDKLSQSPMQGDRVIAVAFKYRLEMPNWRESLRQLSSQDEIFYNFESELLET